MSLNQPKLLRRLSFYDALALVVGSMIGTGIFLKSAIMTEQLGSAGMVLLAWVAAGVLSLSGAFTYAEMGSRFPKAGGEYVYLRECYGPLPAFLYGWTRFWIASTGSVAAYGVGAATFLGAVVPLDAIGGKTVFAILLIAIYTFANCFAVTIGGRLQTVMTALKLFLIIGLAVGISASVSAGQGTLLPLSFTNSAAEPWSAFGTAMIAALWAFDGWNNLPMAAGEVVDGGKNVPRALALGSLMVLAVYLFINVAYFYRLPVEEVATANSRLYPEALPLATKAALGWLGPVAIVVLSLAFVLSSLGAMNGSILTGARVPYAMAQDGLFFSFFGKVGAKSHVPVYSVVLQGIWACVLAISGTFDQLTDWVVFSSWIFYGAVTFGVFLLRRRSGVPEATFKAWGYPWVPAFFLLSTVALLGNTLYTSPVETALGVAFILLGIPSYYAFARRRSLLSR